MHKLSFIPQPNEGHFIRLQLNQDYVVLFSRIKKYLLKPPYTTKCLKYKVPYNNERCLVQCINKIGNKECDEFSSQIYNLRMKHLIQQSKQIQTFILLMNNMEKKIG